jgi:hypothetical protein
MLSLIISGVVFLTLLACGKKGPPFLPERDTPFRVKHLTGEWRDGIVHLKGQVVPRHDEDGNNPDASGCIVYHARYDLENPPCEGCPIEYGTLEEIKTDVLKADRFHCQFRQIKSNGIHFFKVRLIGPKEMPGPSSNGVRILIND